MQAPAILLQPRFLQAPQDLFDFLLGHVEWDERMRARKTASFGVSYDYSQIAYPQVPMPPRLQAVCDQLESALGYGPNNCLLNFYEDGRSSMGFHSDSSKELAPGTGVAIVSLGSERSIVFRSKADKSCEFSYALQAGTLLHMDDEIQQHWLHAIPKADGAGPRISMTFRRIVK